MCVCVCGIFFGHVLQQGSMSSTALSPRHAAFPILIVSIVLLVYKAYQDSGSKTVVVTLSRALEIIIAIAVLMFLIEFWKPKRHCPNLWGLPWEKGTPFWKRVVIVFGLIIQFGFIALLFQFMLRAERNHPGASVELPLDVALLFLTCILYVSLWPLAKLLFNDERWICPEDKEKEKS